MVFSSVSRARTGMIEEQWLSNGLGVTLVLGGLLFLLKYFWPWWTDIYWPARHARDREQYDQLVSLNDRLMEGLEGSARAILQAMANVSDALAYIQEQVKRQEDNDKELLAMSRDSVSGIEALSVIVIRLEEGHEITTHQLERFNEIVTRIGVAYLSDRLKEKKKDESGSSD